MMDYTDDAYTVNAACSSLKPSVSGGQHSAVHNHGFNPRGYFAGEFAQVIGCGVAAGIGSVKLDVFVFQMTVDEPLGACEMEGVADDDDVGYVLQQRGAQGDVFKSAFRFIFDADVFGRDAHVYRHRLHGCRFVAAVAVRAAAHQQPADFVLTVEGDACFHSGAQAGVGLAAPVDGIAQDDGDVGRFDVLGCFFCLDGLVMQPSHAGRPHEKKREEAPYYPSFHK